MSSNSRPPPDQSHPGCFEKFIQLLTALGGGAGIVALLVFAFNQFRNGPPPTPPATQITPLTRDHNSPSNTPPASPVQEQFVIVDSWGINFRLSEGLFSSLNDCRNRVVQLSDRQNYAECLSAPNTVVCSNIHDLGEVDLWECYTNMKECRETLELHELESESRVEAGKSRRIISPACETLPLKEALRKAAL